MDETQRWMATINHVSCYKTGKKEREGERGRERGVLGKGRNRAYKNKTTYSLDPVLAFPHAPMFSHAFSLSISRWNGFETLLTVWPELSTSLRRVQLKSVVCRGRWSPKGFIEADCWNPNARHRVGPVMSWDTFKVLENLRTMNPSTPTTSNETAKQNNSSNPFQCVREHDASHVDSRRAPHRNNGQIYQALLSAQLPLPETTGIWPARELQAHSKSAPLTELSDAYRYCENMIWTDLILQSQKGRRKTWQKCFH